MEDPNNSYREKSRPELGMQQPIPRPNFPADRGYYNNNPNPNFYNSNVNKPPFNNPYNRPPQTNNSFSTSVPATVSQPASDHLNQPSLRDLRSRSRSTTVSANWQQQPTSPTPPPSLSSLQASSTASTTQYIPAQLMNPKPTPVAWTAAPSTARGSAPSYTPSAYNYNNTRPPSFSVSSSNSPAATASRRALPPEKIRSMSDLPKPTMDYSNRSLSRSNPNYEEEISTEDLKLHSMLVDDKTFDELTKSLLTTPNYYSNNNNSAMTNYPRKPEQELKSSFVDSKSPTSALPESGESIAEVTELKLRSMKTALSKYSDLLKDAAKNKDPNAFVDLLGQFEQSYNMQLKSPNSSYPVSPLADDSLLVPNSKPTFEPTISEYNSEPTRTMISPTSTLPRRDLSGVDNPMELASELKDLMQAVKDKIQVQGTPKVREVELLHSIRVQYRKDLELLKEKQRRLIDEISVQHNQELSQLEVNNSSRVEEMKQYVKQLEERLQQTEKRFYEFESQKSQQDTVARYEDDRSRTEKLLRQKTEEIENLRNKLENEMATSELLKQQLFERESKVMDASNSYIEDLQRQIEQMKFAHAQELHQKELAYSRRFEELESVNMSLRASIQQMQDLHSVLLHDLKE